MDSIPLAAARQTSTMINHVAPSACMANQFSALKSGHPLRAVFRCSKYGGVVVDNLCHLTAILRAVMRHEHKKVGSYSK